MRALVAAEAGERLTELGDLDSRFGAPHEWDRLWVILQGAPPLAGALTEDTLAAIRSGATAAAAGDVEAARDAHDLVRVAIVRAALEAIGDRETPAADAYFRGVVPLLMTLDPSATQQLSTHLEEGNADHLVSIQTLVTQLADDLGVEVSFVLADS